MRERKEQNIAVVQRFIAGAVNGRDPSVLDETWCDDLIWHGGSLGAFHGKAAFMAAFTDNASSAWSGMRLEIHEIIPSGDKVVLRFTNSDTNIGPFMSFPPTGKHAEWLGIGIYTVRDGRITEGSFAEDILGVLMQLDLAPVPTVQRPTHADTQTHDRPADESFDALNFGDCRAVQAGPRQNGCLATNALV